MSHGQIMLLDSMLRMYWYNRPAHPVSVALIVSNHHRHNWLFPRHIHVRSYA